MSTLTIHGERIREIINIWENCRHKIRGGSYGSFSLAYIAREEHLHIYIQVHFYSMLFLALLIYGHDRTKGQRIC